VKQSISSFFLLTLLVAACGTDPVPKPKGHIRIDLPEKSYHEIETDCPFQFEIPDYSVFQIRPQHQDKCWFNLHFPENRAKIHFTYKEIDGNLRQLLEESHQLSYEHHVKAHDIVSEKVERDSACVYGLVYYLEGGVASPLQFYLTDSTNHFLRGSLYFNVTVNSDSLQPVVDFIARDVDHLIQTMRWNPSSCD